MAKTNTLRESVYGSLKAMIVTGQMPAGARVTENDIATKLNVSRTPVREALNRLERDGLVQGRPRQGYLVRDFDLTMFSDAFQVRETLDGLAAELATDKATDADMARLNQILLDCAQMAALPNRSNKDKFQELQLGIDLHRVIAEISGNAMLMELVGGILDKCQHYIWTELLWLDEWEATRQEHSEIVAAICSGDRTLAGELARRHVRGSREATLRLLRAKSDYALFGNELAASEPVSNPDLRQLDIVGQE
jgi:DNA-binding GntR family transcriptional regulator